eukprot:gene9175-16306_t
MSTTAGRQTRSLKLSKAPSGNGRSGSDLTKQKVGASVDRRHEGRRGSACQKNASLSEEHDSTGSDEAYNQEEEQRQNMLEEDEDDEEDSEESNKGEGDGLASEDGEERSPKQKKQRLAKTGARALQPIGTRADWDDSPLHLQNRPQYGAGMGADDDDGEAMLSQEEEAANQLGSLNLMGVGKVYDMKHIMDLSVPSPNTLNKYDPNMKDRIIHAIMGCVESKAVLGLHIRGGQELDNHSDKLTHQPKELSPPQVSAPVKDTLEKKTDDIADEANPDAADLGAEELPLPAPTQPISLEAKVACSPGIAEVADFTNCSALSLPASHCSSWLRSSREVKASSSRAISDRAESSAKARGVGIEKPEPNIDLGVVKPENVFNEAVIPGQQPPNPPVAPLGIKPEQPSSLQVLASALQPKQSSDTSVSIEAIKPELVPTGEAKFAEEVQSANVPSRPSPQMPQSFNGGRESLDRRLRDIRTTMASCQPDDLFRDISHMKYIGGGGYGSAYKAVWNDISVAVM